MARFVVPRLNTLLNRVRELEHRDALEALIVDSKSDQFEEALGRAPLRVRELVEGHRRSLVATIHVATTLSSGVRNRSSTSQPKLVTSHWTSAGKAMTNIQLATALFRMHVLFTCAELEYFVREFATWAVTTRSVPAILARAKKKTKRQFNVNPARARKELIDWVKPSSGARSPSWPARLSIVFGVPIPAAVSRPLQTLIMWRNEFSHLGHPAYEIDWQDTYELDDALITPFLAAIGLHQVLARPFLR